MSVYNKNRKEVYSYAFDKQTERKAELYTCTPMK
jgi:hypothetical protein